MRRAHNQGLLHVHGGARRLLQGGVASAPFSTIANDGWQVTVSSPTDLSLTPVSVSRQGFDATGAQTTHSDTLYLTKRVRQAYPNQDSFTADRVALSDVLYSTDAVAGVTNSSPLTSPKPIANWVMPGRQTVGNTLPWELIAYHYNGRPDPTSGIGRQVACVRVRATNGTDSTAWQTVADTNISTLCEDAVPVEVFSGVLDVSAFADGAAVWLEAEVYPWIGGAAAVLKSEDVETTYPGDRSLFTRRYFRKDVARVATFWKAYVASTGNDTSGVASQTAETAAASPCLTVAGALAKLRTAAGATTRGSMDNAHIYIVDSVAGGAVTFQSYYPQDIGAVIVTRAPTSTRAAAQLTISAALRPYFVDHSTGISEGALTLKDLTVAIGDTGTFTGETATHLDVMLWNVTISAGTGAGRGNAHLSYFGANFSSYGGANSVLSRLAANRRVRIKRGVTVTLANYGHEGVTTVGCAIAESAAMTFLNPTQDGFIWAHNLWRNARSNLFTLVTTSAGQRFGLFAVAYNVVEVISATDLQPTFFFSADSANGNMPQGAVCIHNTIAGAKNAGRLNVFYDETVGAARVHGAVAMKGNLWPQVNVKGDDFINDGSRTGHFIAEHGVGWHGNFAIDVDASSGTDSFRQAYPGLSSVIGGGSPLFINNQAVTHNGSAYVAGSGGGTYTLQGGSPALNMLPAPLTKFDFAGAARGTGPQAAGAYA